MYVLQFAICWIKLRPQPTIRITSIVNSPDFVMDIIRESEKIIQHILRFIVEISLDKIMHSCNRESNYKSPVK